MITVETERLRLVTCPGDTRREVLERTLSVRVPPDWPLELADLLPWYRRELEADPSIEGWGPWLMIARDEETVVGDLGFTGRPDAEGGIEIGYSVLPAWRRRGYASEAVARLLRWAFDHPAVTHVVAGCDADNVASIRVLEGVGMQLVGRTDDTLSWELRR